MLFLLLLFLPAMVANFLQGIEPGAFYTFVLCCMAVLMVWDKVLSIRNKSKGPATLTVSAPVPELPQPIRIIHEDQFVTVDAFKEIKDKVEQMPAMERRLNKDNEERVEAIHLRINEINTKVDSAVAAVNATKELVQSQNDIVKAVLRRKT